MSLRKKMRSMINWLAFWKGDRNVTGVADVERHTKLKQEKEDRAKEREELIRLVKEDRLHEADERQLESIKLALELRQILESKKETPDVDANALADAVKSAVSEAISQLPVGGHSAVENPSRPRMRHAELTNFKHGDSGLKISDGDTLTEKKEGEEKSADKLRRLRELKGNK